MSYFSSQKRDEFQLEVYNAERGNFSIHGKNILILADFLNVVQQKKKYCGGLKCQLCIFILLTHLLMR